MEKRVCVLDGGGMRGFYQLELLRLVMHGTREKNVPINLIVGVSAGAIVGAMLALNMLDDEKFNSIHFQRLTQEIFNRKTAQALWARPKYDGIAKRKTLLDYFGNRQFKDVQIPLCVVCSTMDGGVANYCSWKPEHASLLLADVLNASSAAPLYFPPVQLQGLWITDGGIRANKPLLQALLFSWELFGKAANIRMLSIGTYYSSQYRFDGKRAPYMGLLGWLKQGIVHVLMGTQDTTNEDLCHQLLGDKFLRLMCMCDDVRLDDHGMKVQEILTQSANNTFYNNKSKIAALWQLEFV